MKFQRCFGDTAIREDALAGARMGYGSRQDCIIRFCCVRFNEVSRPMVFKREGWATARRCLPP